MSPELSKKERTAQRRQALTQDLYSVFVRSYEMDRAWKMPQKRAQEKAFQVFNKHVDALIRQKPQETSFIIGCRIEAKEQALKRIAELEGQVTHGQDKR